MFKTIIRFLQALNSNHHPGEIAHAICLGMILGFLPKSNALWYIFTVFFVFMRVNKASLTIFTVLFSLLAPSLDPLFDTIGYKFLTLEPLVPFFSKILDIPFVGFTKFNNTIVSGSILFSIACYIPVYLLVRFFIKFWRTTLAPVVRKTKLIVFLSKIPLIKKIGEIV